MPLQKSFILTFALCACLASADVSHLSSSYLPPANSGSEPEHAISTSIEQQQLRELPEQVDSMNQGLMEDLTPPAPIDSMPAARYLPPAEPMPELKAAEPAMEYMAPMPAEEQPAMRYLPPAVQATEPQPTYQQYQEELARQQMLEQEQEQQEPQEPLEEQQPAMSYSMDEAQQPMAPSDMDMMAAYEEAQPSHELRDDGYHYKAVETEQSLRH
ncbi:putative uncharacterized protein DDB_G0294196 [Scaptodrosophila lebanonensis]|uniref:Uncharacterized protein n=1 Tax=Drosophila lebanonensis TaxID=7225 RepID=A0A6J2T8K3_DROLE|nr:putative uncharacterized protein DDB_G0294196 [Scaptodrosophila lebanonensis]